MQHVFPGWFAAFLVAALPVIQDAHHLRFNNSELVVLTHALWSADPYRFEKRIVVDFTAGQITFEEGSAGGTTRTTVPASQPDQRQALFEQFKQSFAQNCDCSLCWR